MNRAGIYILLVCATLVAACSESVDGDEFDPDVGRDAAVDAGDSIGGDVAPVDDGVPTPRPDRVDIGAPCTEDEHCGSTGVCLSGENYPNGYCSKPCDDECTCFEFPNNGEYCASACVEPARDDERSCRSGYVCAAVGTDPSPACIPAVFAPAGTPCSTDGECFGSCLVEWPDGYCTSPCVDARCPGGSGAVCKTVDATRGCFQRCLSSAGCRDGYVCDRQAHVDGICRPPRMEHSPYSVSISCDADRDALLEYIVPRSEGAYVAVPFSFDGAPFSPAQVVLPSGRTVAFDATDGLYPAGLLRGEGIVPFMMPPHRQRSHFLEVGTHHLELFDARNRELPEELCVYVMQKNGVGGEVQLNFRFVGLTDLSASTAPASAPFQDVVARIESLLTQARIGVGRVRYYDASPGIAQTYQIMAPGAATELVKASGDVGEDERDSIAINVFIVRSMYGGLGISAGIPGAPGLHGSASSGVVVAGEFWRDEPALFAETTAHEIGHFIGLRHPSEQSGGRHDDLVDTVECTEPEGCLEQYNLMFPLAVGGTRLTPEQAWVLRMSPHVVSEGDVAECGECSGREECALAGNGDSRCRCATGLEPGTNRCIDLDECPGACHTDAVCTDGFGLATCRCASGFTGDGQSCAPRSPEPEQIDVGRRGLVCAIRANGTIRCWRSDRPDPAPTPPLGQYRYVAVGDDYACALDLAGKAVCFGDHGGVGRTTPPQDVTFRTIEAWNDHACGLTATDEIECWGDDRYGALDAPAGTFRHLSLRYQGGCAVTLAGDVECWGANPPDVGDEVVNEANRACVLTTDGAMFCPDEYMLLGPFKALADRDACGLASDGSVQCLNDNYDRPGPFDQFDAHASLLCGIDRSDDVHCWDHSGPRSVPADL